MKNILLIIFTALIIVSCEETVDGDLPFEEQIVISSVLSAGNKILPIGISFVHIGKTIHPLERPDTNQSYVKNGKVTISTGSEEYDLKYSKMGYWVNDDFIPEEGKTYKIEVEYNGKKASAETTIPIYSIEKGEKKTEIKQSRDWDGELYYQYIVKQKFKVNLPKYALFISEIFYFDDVIYDNYYDEPLYTNNNTEDEFEVELYRIGLSDLSDTMFIKDTRYNSIDLFDPAVELFWNTRYQGQDESGVFGGGGLNREGNIKNGLGFFYGNTSRIDSLKIEF